MKKLNKEKLIEKLDEWFETVASYGYREDSEAHQQIRKLIEEKPITKEDIFNFHNNLMTISGECAGSIFQEIEEKERKYIKH